MSRNMITISFFVFIAVNIQGQSVKSFRAFHNGSRVLLEWRVEPNTQNYGYHIYREVQTGKVRLTPTMLTGAMFFSHFPLTAGQISRWWDMEPVPDSRYWIEVVESDGNRNHLGPALPEWVGPWPLPTLSNIRTGPVSRMSQKQTDQPILELLPEVRQQNLAGRPAIKIEIREEGWYQINSLVGRLHGMQMDVDPRKLRLFTEGQEVAIVSPDQGWLGTETILGFYGQGADTPWTDTRTYWLIVDDMPGQRITGEEWLGETRAGPVDFVYTAVLRPRYSYFSALSNGDEENFFGPLIGPERVDIPVVIMDPGSSSDFEPQAEIILQGASTGLHVVEVCFNDDTCRTIRFEGKIRHSEIIAIPPPLLEKGENQLSFMARGGDIDLSFVDTVKISYARQFKAHEGQLRFTAKPGEEITIDGFSRSDIMVLDVTQPNTPRLIPGDTYENETGYGVRFTPVGTGIRQMLAISTGEARTPVIRQNHPSAWTRFEEGAELVIITHGSFLDAAQKLQTRRKEQGWSVAVVDVEDLYDEFEFSRKSPHAIREFLMHAHQNWSIRPEYLILLGDASFDPRDYRNLGPSDFIPSKLVATRTIETVSDDWFGDLDGDGLSEIAIGRLPVRTTSQANAVIEKIMAYESRGTLEPWRQRALVVADGNTDFDFHAAVNDLAPLLAGDRQVEMILTDSNNPSEAASQLATRINKGQSLIFYLGHGSIDSWSAANLLDTERVGELVNGFRQPVVISLTCLNGFFHHVNGVGLAEKLVTMPNGGAIAVWASSGSTFPSHQLAMNEAWVRQISANREITIGKAVLAAKASVDNEDVRKTWILFGDPTLKLN